uniref:Retrotransposon gag domain-containing protein n=1 Tax=Cucumis melo TaxID=3656 RepID=A0A9I9E933_CUCME
MEKKFLEKCFALTKAISIMVEIYGIKQANGETLHEYWEWFKELCSTAGGALSYKTPTEARAFMARMGENTQTFGSRIESCNSSSSEISGLKNQMSYLISMVMIDEITRWFDTKFVALTHTVAILGLEYVRSYELTLKLCEVVFKDQVISRHGWFETMFVVLTHLVDMLRLEVFLTLFEI